MQPIRILTTLAALVCLATAGAATVATTPAAAVSAPAATEAPTCEVDLLTFGGFQVFISVANTTTAPLTNWTVQFTLPTSSRIESRFNGTITLNGTAGTFHPASWIATLAPGTEANVGFGGSGTAPTAFALNGVPCTLV
ncbi:cellulose binding domain-containing protein [Micromonospora sp. KC721]|uniref:cellulose binding domain-containing protein n=1 Tax=Micromonospora sp. KC721 TaxID=2530380 RepID=UPI00104B370C|nr:cellulose binding domain-containing protein [Micromonospora sp. KC721]TDB81829.1 hypothetical protein E1182_03855 [Micromonospora sp. KC721]